MNYILGVTGGIGCGKTAATKQFASHGIPIIDADIIAKDITAKNPLILAQIAEHFGPSILLKNGQLNRQQLRETIFNNTEEKEWLEALLHPEIQQAIIQALKKQKDAAAYTILSAPLLLEGKLHTLVNKVLVIDCDEALQLERASQRDRCNIEALKKIIAQQMSRNERLSKADDIIVNNKSIASLENAIDKYHHQLLRNIA